MIPKRGSWFSEYARSPAFALRESRDSIRVGGIAPGFRVRNPGYSSMRTKRLRSMR